MSHDAGSFAPLLALLARLSLAEVDRPLLEALRRDEILGGLEKAEPGCAASVAQDWSDDDIERAAAEYCALFVLPDGPSPRASAWLEGERETVGAGIDDLVSRVLAALDLAPTGTLERVPRDHLGFLLHLAALALDDEREDVRSVGEVLLATTAAPWIDGWAAAVRERATLPLYRAHASLMAAVVRERAFHG